jgi:glycosyltransferase involved in cell wall biosynthesis
MAAARTGSIPVSMPIALTPVAPYSANIGPASRGKPITGTDGNRARSADTIRVAGSTQAFADQVLALLDAPKTAARLGSAARAQVLARYGWDARLAPLDALLGLTA